MTEAAKGPVEPVRELGRSALRFSLAVSMHGLQQAVRLLTPPRASDPFRAMLGSLDAVSRTMERQLGTPLQVTQMVGDALQRSLLELLSPAGADGPGRSPWASERGERFEEALRRLTPRVIARLHDALGAEGADTLRAESANKVALDRIISGVFEISPASAHAELGRHLDRVRERPPAEVPWALLALGRRWAAGHLQAAGGSSVRGADWSQAVTPADHLFFQLGIATELADRRCRDLEAWTPLSQIRKLLERQAAELQALALPGSERLGAEVIGRALADTGSVHLLRSSTEHLRRVDERSADAMWHGVGRAAYLSAENFVPEPGDPWPGLLRCEADPPDARAAARMTAGFVFALVVVNAASPEVVVRFLDDPARHRPGTGDGLVAGLRALFLTVGELEDLAPWRDRAAAGSGEAEILLASALERADRLPARLDELVSLPLEG